MTADQQCICRGNWRQIVGETEHLIGRRYKDTNDSTWTFFGLVHGGDDYYYGMTSKGGGTQLLSCVGSIEGFGWSLIDE